MADEQANGLEQKISTHKRGIIKTILYIVAGVGILFGGYTFRDNIEEHASDIYYTYKYAYVKGLDQCANIPNMYHQSLPDMRVHNTVGHPNKPYSK